MEKLTYKTFVWPQNPESFCCSFLREPVYIKDGYGNTVFWEMGPRKLTVTGSGAFFGTTAYADFLALRAVFEDSTPGELVHPVMGTCQAYFTRLEATQEPRTDYVAYRFEFQGTDSNGAIPK